MQASLNVLGRALLIGAIGLLAACGPDEADNEPDGAGGSGGEGGSDSAPTAEQSCLDFCHQTNENGCDARAVDCAALCRDRLESAGAECEDQAGALFACMRPFAASCPDEPPPACERLGEELEECIELHGCGGELCGGGGGVGGGGGAEGGICGCESTCQGKQYETRCETPAGGDTTCVCLVGGVEVGTCEGESATACGVKESCCQTEYFNIP
ncbi:hypothetical protein WME99_37250 [Sorangium sp. So ce136]|uniref:hypothetical protein n=1 Tax=Sorangium sp. So ce136 TaxID=3133284 RepID=UPI003F018BBB